MTISLRKLALQQIAAACVDGGKVPLAISMEDRRAIEPELSLMGRKLKALISITGSSGDFIANVQPLRQDNTPKPRGRATSPERKAIEGLEPGGSTTISLGDMSLESIDQKIHAVQRNLDVMLTRHYDRETRTVTVQRIDGTPGSERFKSRGRQPKYQMQDMKAGDVLFVIGGVDLRTMRTTCTYHSKARSNVQFKAFESDYDGAIEIHCIPRTFDPRVAEAARRSIKRRRIARVLDGEAIFKPDGSTFGSTPGSTITGYGGVQFFASMIDDVLDVVSPNESVHFPGVQPAKLAERANHWATVRSLKPRVNGDAVWFE